MNQTPPIDLDHLPGRDLTREELRQVASALAADPERWAQHVRHSDEERHYASLFRDANVDVWLICWTPVSDTGWHDHDCSAGAVAVARGGVVEQCLVLGRAPVESEAPEGTVFSFGPDHIHRMRGRDSASVTVHVYSPPLWRMGQYTTVDGVLRRQSMSYAEELRPVEPAARG